MPAFTHRTLARLTLLGCLTAAGGSLAAPTPTTSRAAAPLVKLPELATYELANGLRVAVLRTTAAPVVSVQMWVRAGSKDEPRDRRGLANVVEHLMFRGSRHVRDGAHLQLVAGVGGIASAAADEDATHFVDTLPSADVAFAIQLEADRLRGLLLRAETFADEREVVKDDARRSESSPVTRGFLRVLETAFTKHPYAWSTAGAVRDLDATTLADAKQFYDAYYQPNNALLVIVGDVQPDAVKAAVEASFGPIPRAAEPPRPAAAATEPPQTAARRETGTPSSIGLALVGYHVPAAADADSYAVQVAAIILGGGDSSRLRAALRPALTTAKPGAKPPAAPLARDAGIQLFVRQDPGIAIAYAIFSDGANGAAVESAIGTVVKTLGTAGPSPAELRKAKSQVQSAFVFSLENAQGIADAVGRSWVLTGDLKSAFDEGTRVEAVTAADVKRVVSKYMTPGLATTVSVAPGGGTVRTGGAQ